jgi:MFS family permease
LTGVIGRIGGGLGRPFWTVLSASGLANLADGVFWVALPLLAVGLTDSPALVAGVTVASRLPWLVFALVAGAMADRLDRRRTMILVDVGRVVLLAGLGLSVVIGVATIWLLYVVAFLLGVLETLFDTAAQSMLPNVVDDRDRLTAANSRLFGVELTMNQFVGPPVGGLLAASGLALAFGTSAAAYLGAALLLLSLSGTFRAERSGPSTKVLDDIAEGMRYQFGHSLLRTLALVVGMLNLAGGAVWAILVLYAVAPGPMGLDAVGFGLLLTAMAVGTVGGTVMAGFLERRLGKPNLLVVCIVALAIEHMTLALTADPFIVGGVLALGGLFLGAFNPVFVSLRMRIVPGHLLGRVVASFRVLGMGTLPLGALLGGLLGEAFGLTAVFVSAAILTIVLLPARLVITDARIAAAEAAVAGEPAGAAPGDAAPGSPDER